jgi:transcriptional regulator with GAF, ATPase, and Fis domain
LLRVLQEKEIERVGGTKSIQVDIRVIAATHRNLEDMISRGAFREDLYFRLKVFPILIPPLRERGGDIPALVHHFMHKKSLEMKLGFMPTLESKALERLMAYEWPGNVRELENAVERSLILCQGKPLTFADLDSSSHVPQEPRSEQADERLTLNQVMERHIRRVLKISNGKIEGKGGAAELLEINPGTLRHRMRVLGIPFGRKVKQ